MAKTTACLLSATVMFVGTPLYADVGLPQPDVYNFGPEGRSVQDLQEFAKPSMMMGILPGRPVAAREKDGSRVYFTAGGKLSVTVARDGSMQFTLGVIQNP